MSFDRLDNGYSILIAVGLVLRALWFVVRLVF